MKDACDEVGLNLFDLEQLHRAEIPFGRVLLLQMQSDWARHDEGNDGGENCARQATDQHISVVAHGLLAQLFHAKGCLGGNRGHGCRREENGAAVGVNGEIVFARLHARERLIDGSGDMVFCDVIAVDVEIEAALIAIALCAKVLMFGTEHVDCRVFEPMIAADATKCFIEHIC